MVREPHHGRGEDGRDGRPEKERILYGPLLGGPDGEGVLEGLDLGVQFLDFAKFGGEAEDGANGTEAEFPGLDFRGGR